MGLAITTVAFVLLVAAIRSARRTATQLLARVNQMVQTKSIEADFADLVKALTELIKLVGVGEGVPLVAMILGILLVSVGAGLLTAGIA